MLDYTIHWVLKVSEEEPALIFAKLLPKNEGK
jgi:hypothetical protein